LANEIGKDPTMQLFFQLFNSGNIGPLSLVMNGDEAEFFCGYN